MRLKKKLWLAVGVVVLALATVAPVALADGGPPEPNCVPGTVCTP